MSPFDKPLLTSKAVMAHFGYTDVGGFWDFVHREAVPHIRVTPRKILFNQDALEQWVKHRSVGRHDKPLRLSA